MYDCWKQFGKGKIDFLDDYDFGTSDNYCFICTQIKFSEDIKNKKITDFAKYLDETKIYLENITYTEYFTESKNAKFSGVPELASLNEVPTSEDLYILFLAKKEGASPGTTPGEALAKKHRPTPRRRRTEQFAV